ncbi:hypothetical protein VO54_02677 [Elizabethkingia miricola]|nr:hypothetical protein VO54_02677 [Elizabethkingia miricola]MCT4327032.1 hypothetical protein [Elizabethkingia anophelis]
MKKNNSKKKSLNLGKLQIAKLNNPQQIRGGNEAESPTCLNPENASKVKDEGIRF